MSDLYGKLAARQKELQATKTNQPTIYDKLAARQEELKGGVPAPSDSASATESRGMRMPKVDPDSFGSNVGRSIDRMQANAGAAVEAVGDVTGLKGMQQWGKEVSANQLEEASQYGDPTISSYTQVEDKESLGTYLSNLAEGALAPIGAAVGAGAAAAKVTPGGPLPKAIAGFGTALGVGVTDSIGTVQNLQRELAPDRDPNSWASIAGGTVAGAIGTAGPAVMLKPLVASLGRDAVEQILVHNGVAKNVATEMLKGAALSGGAEAVASGGQAATEYIAGALGTDTAIDPDRLIEDSVNAMVGGGLVDTPAGGMTHGVAAAKHNNLVDGRAVDATPFNEETTITGKPKTEEPGLAEKLFNGMGMGALAGLDPLARVSTQAKEFTEIFRPDMSGRTATKATIFEDQRMMAGEYNTRMDDLVRAAGGKKKFNDVIDRYTKGDRSDELTRGLHKVLEDFHTLAKEKGQLEVGKLENYLPFRIDIDRIKNDRDAFLADITPFFDSPDAAIHSLDNYIAKVSSTDNDSVPKIARLAAEDPTNPDAIEIAVAARRDKDNPDSMKFKFSQGTIPPEFGHLEKNRAFSGVPQSVLNKWTKEQKVGERLDALRDYFEGGAHRIAYSSRFGAKGDLANGMIAKMIRQAQAQGRDVSKSEVNRMYDVLDSYSGLYGKMADSGLKTAQSVASAAVTIPIGTLFTLSSITELMTPAIRGDVAHALSSVMPALGEGIRGMVRGIFKDIPLTEHARIASEANLTLQASTNVAAQRLGNNQYTRGVAKVMTTYFKINLLSYMTHTNTAYAAKAGDMLFMDALKEISMGVPVNSPRGRYLTNQLRSMGLDVQDAATAKRYWQPQGDTQHKQARQARVLAMTRFARQAVLEPNISDTPLWTQHGHLQLLSMLKKYPTAFTNTILPALMRKADPAWAGSYSQASLGAFNILGILGAMIGIGYMQDELKQIAKGVGEGEDLRTEGQRFVDIVNISFMPVHLTYLSDFFAAPRYGTSGVEAVAGPAIGLVGETGKTIHHYYKNGDESVITKYLYRRTPVAFNRPGREWASELGE